MRKASPSAGTTILATVALAGWLGCSPAAREVEGEGGTGGSGAAASGGANAGAGGAGGVSGTGGAGQGGAGVGGAGTGGAGTGGAGAGGSTASGGTSGSGGSSGGDAGATDAGASDGAAAGPVTFTKIFTEILTPGCTGANNACHSVVRDQYFLFGQGEKARSHMLLVPTAPSGTTIPQRVMTLLNYVTPTNAANPNSVRMPPQSGPNLGNPPVMKPPLTAAQVALIRMWAMSGAKND